MIVFSCWVLEEFFDDFHAARKCYETGISLDPTFEKCYNNLGVLLEERFEDFDGAAYFIKHQKYICWEARKNYELALELIPTYTLCRSNLGNLLEEKFNDFEGARKMYEQILEENPNDSGCHSDLGNEHCFSIRFLNKYQYQFVWKLNSNFSSGRKF